MKKFTMFAVICASITIGSVTYAGNVAKASEPITYTQQEVKENISLLQGDIAKCLFDIASFTDVKKRDQTMEKLRITKYLISEWETHLSTEYSTKDLPDVTQGQSISLEDQRDNLFYEFTILFKEAVKLQKQLPYTPSVQVKYDYLVKRMYEIKAEHAKLTGDVL